MVLRPHPAYSEARGGTRRAPQLAPETQNHLVSPVDVFEDEHQPLTHGNDLDDLGHALKELTIVHGTESEFVLGPAQFGKKPEESRAVERGESRDDIVHGIQV